MTASLFANSGCGSSTLVVMVKDDDSTATSYAKCSGGTLLVL
jgi:hypothetical protein